jgi:thiosulfate dehydrogenase
MKGFLLGLILGLLVLPLFVFLHLHLGSPAVAVADAPYWLEREIVRIPLHARIDKEMPKTAPFEPSATNLEAGAHIYRQQCAACHGLYGRPSSFASHMYPHAPQLWAPHGSGVVGVSDDPPGETYWKVANGIRLSGMPSYSKVLNETQMWQVSLLLANADKPLPAAALNLLKRPLDLDPAPAAPQASEAPPQKITDQDINSMPSPVPPDNQQ